MDSGDAAGCRSGGGGRVLPRVRNRADVHASPPARGRSLTQPDAQLHEHVDGRSFAVTGGAGFVGSNLTRRLIELGASEIHIVDNLLSADRSNVPDDTVVTFLEGSITEDAMLQKLPAQLDGVFHLATFHGNQSSMADPIADHDNNTFTTLKLLEHLSSLTAAPRVVYASAGCTLAEK